MLASSEIAISPFILPLDPASNTYSSTTASSQASQAGLDNASIQPFAILEGDKLVIPQKPLYAAYVYACKSLARVCSGPSYRAQVSTRSDHLTKVILIQNPEHAKALNMRKRLVLRDATPRAISAELYYTSLVLGIAANAKMSPLWHHRRWLLSLLYSTTSIIPQEFLKARTRHIWRIKADLALPEDVVKREIALVDQAAKRYPRNYQAWAYKSWLLRCINAGPQHDYIAFAKAELQATTAHLRLNPTDHTAMVYVATVLQSRYSREDNALDMHKVALDLAQRYPHREMPWLFLRFLRWQAVGSAIESLDEEISALIRSIQEVGRLDKSKRTDWEEDETKQAVRYSRRTEFYLAWVRESGTTRGLGSVDARRLLEETRL